MGRPPPCVLFAQSFLHPRLAEYVDEVRFTEPVVISACEILELHTPSLCATLSLSGVSSPQSFALEIFIRSGGEARFKRLCPGFLYSPSASNLLEVQAAVTDHLVIRGSYKALSLVVYGNPARDLGQFNVDHDIESTLSDLIIPCDGVCKPEDLPGALRLIKGKQCGQLLPLQCLRLIYEDSGLLSTCRRLINLVAGIVEAVPNSDIVCKISSIILSVASAFMSADKIDDAFFQFPLVGAVSSQQKEGDVKSLLERAIKQVEEIYECLQSDSTGSMKQPLSPANESSMVEIVLQWLQSFFQSLSEIESSTLLGNAFENNFMGCLAAVELLCMDVQCCFRFVVNGGMRLLVDILQFSFTESSAAVLLLLEAMKFSCRHAFACEALLGWWPLSDTSIGGNNSLKTGYVVILRLLLQTKRFYVAHMAAQILHHLRVYELAASFQSLAEPLLENSSIGVLDLKLQTGMELALKKASVVLKQFVEILSTSDRSYDQSPAQTTQWLILDGDDSTSTLTLNATFDLIASSNYCVAIQGLNPHVLVALQERRLLPLLAALLSASWMRSMVGHKSELFLEFLGIVQNLLLILINCRSGILFLASDLEAASAIVSALGQVQDARENDLVNYRHALSLTSKGFLCHPQDVATVLETSLSVINSIDQLLVATTKLSEDRLWALWELTVFSRTEAGRQALSAITFFPEVFLLVMEALQPESLIAQTDTIEERGLKRAIIHSAAVLMHVILTDQSACTLAAWLPHALLLQKNLLSCSPTNIDLAVGNGAGSKDTLCARLLDWVDAAVVYHKKGAVGLLRYAAAVVVGSANQLAAVGLPVSDSVEPDSNVGEASGNTELPTVETLLGRGVTFDGSGTILSDTAVIQLTVSMRILASISCHPGVAAFLYGEGVMPILYLVLEYGAVFLQTSSHDYDYVVEEDGDGDGTLEILIEQARERLLLSLLLPTLLLLLSLLKRLQATGEEYRNTRLVEILLFLHRGISARLVSRATIPAEAGGMLVLVAASRVVVSVLACWPIFGWTPSLFLKLLGIDSKTAIGYTGPLEPKEASSVLRILGDMLPDECPQLCTDRAAAINIYRSLAVQTLLGRKSMDVVGWHCHFSVSQKLVKLLVPHLDQIASMIFHLASTTCAVLQELLKLLVIRFACQSKDNTLMLVRPFLSYLREHTAVGHSISDIDAFRVERYLHFVSGLLQHPATKRVLLQEGLLSLLLQVLSMKDFSLKVDGIKILSLNGDDSPSVIDVHAARSGWVRHILNSFSLICDPYVSLVPAASLNRRLVEDCPSFDDYCSIVIAILRFFKFAVIGDGLETLVDVIGRIGSNKVGRAAFASYALSNKFLSLKHLTQRSFPDITIGSATLDTKEPRSDITEVAHAPPFFLVWKQLAAAFDEDKVAEDDIAHLIERFAFACIQLSGAGRSTCGLGALQILSGFNAEDQTQDLGERQKQPVLFVLQCLKERCKEDEDDEHHDPSPFFQESAYRKALKAVNVLWRVLRRATNTSQMEKRFKMVVDEISRLHSSPEQEIGLNELPIYWSALPMYFSRLEEENEVNGRDNMENVALSFKDSLKEKFSWDCSAIVPDRPSMAGPSSKRKPGMIADGTGKKHHVDLNSIEGVGTNLIVRAGTGTNNSVTSITRRDNFRQRKPNTSRPPSMHVDDYVARERGNDAASGSVMNQRSGPGGGRPPSIHVDEFMARQRERQIVVGGLVATDAPSLSQLPQQHQSKHPSPSKSDSATNMIISRRMLTDDDELHDVNIDIDGVPDADDLSSLPGADDLMINSAEEDNLLAAAAAAASNSKDLPELLSVTGNQKDTTSEGVPATRVNELSVNDNTCKEVMTVDAESQSKSLIQQQMQLRHQSVERDEMRQQSSVSIRASHSMPPSAQITGTSLPQVREVSAASIVQSSLGEQRPPITPAIISSVPSSSSLQFATGPPLPSLPPPPPIPAGVIPQKYDSFASPVMEQRLGSAGMPVPAFELPVNTIRSGRERRPPLPPDYLRGGTEAVASSLLPLPLPRPPAPPLPPLPPPQSWPALEHPGQRMDTGQRPSSSAVAFCLAPSSHPLRPLIEPTVGAQMSHTPVPPWTTNSRIVEELGTSGTGRPPPLPPTPPPFSTSQAGHLQISPPNPSSMQSVSPYPPNVGSLPLDNRPAYVITSAVDVSQSDKRVDSFASPVQGQPSPFIPPLPPGRPQSILPLQQQQTMQVLPTPLQPPPPPGPPPPPPLAQQPEQSHPALQPHFQHQMKQPFQHPSQQQVQQQESGKLLQQILASPDAIQDLLKDQNKLQRLLEQHPKLISLLQEKMR